MKRTLYYVCPECKAIHQFNFAKCFGCGWENIVVKESKQFVQFMHVLGKLETRKAQCKTACVLCRENRMLLSLLKIGIDPKVKLGFTSSHLYLIKPSEKLYSLKSILVGRLKRKISSQKAAERFAYLCEGMDILDRTVLCDLVDKKLCLKIKVEDLAKIERIVKSKTSLPKNKKKPLSVVKPRRKIRLKSKRRK